MPISSSTDLLSNYPSEWPPKEFFTIQHDLSNEQLATLKKLVESNSGETEIDQFIQRNPEVLSIALRFGNTGHHGAWILPQQAVRPKLGNLQAGLIPDYIVGGKNSDGFQWWIVELKGVNATAFVKRKNDISFSTTLNEGICQLVTYIDYCAEIQSNLRDQFKLTGFREPKGIIIIGREQEFNESEQKQKLKAAWNKITGGKLEIRTYDALLRIFEDILTFRDAQLARLNNNSRKDE